MSPLEESLKSIHRQIDALQAEIIELEREADLKEETLQTLFDQRDRLELDIEKSNPEPGDVYFLKQDKVESERSLRYGVWVLIEVREHDVVFFYFNPEMRSLVPECVWSKRDVHEMLHKVRTGDVYGR